MLRCLTTVAALLAIGPYRMEIVKWRHQKEAALKADGGWLTVTGLVWLKEGDNRVAPAPGVFELHNGKTVFRAGSGAITQMKPDTTITVGKLIFTVIERGGRYGVRIKDNDSKQRAEFQGQRWFPVREQYRVTARFVAQQKSIAIPNVLGDTLQLTSPGYAVFQIAGQELRLEPVIEDKELFFIFRDQTAGRETYGAGRFLYTETPKNGMVELDFNKAENPPCAFTPYATCPLPPRQNILPVRIEAGELAPAGTLKHATQFR